MHHRQLRPLTVKLSDGSWSRDPTLTMSFIKNESLKLNLYNISPESKMGGFTGEELDSWKSLHPILFLETLGITNKAA